MTADSRPPVPTFNSYTGESGYYIRACPPDTGNITYQIEPQGERILKRLGFDDGDEVGWAVIQSLKVVDLVYTGDSGVPGSDDTETFQPEDATTEGLPEERVASLYEELSDLHTIDDSQVNKIQEILNISLDKTLDVPQAEIQEQVQSLYHSSEIPASLQTFDNDEPRVSVSRDNGRSRPEVITIRIAHMAYSNAPSEEYSPAYLIFKLRVRAGSISEVMITSDLESSWEIQADVYRYLGAVLPSIVNSFRRNNVEIDSSWSDISIKFEYL